MKNALIVGATGMTGGLVLDECINSHEIEQVISISRRPSGKSHDKLKEVIHKDYLNLDEIASHFENIDILYFCIGVYTGAVEREKFKEITVDYTKTICGLLKEKSPNAVVCFLSGQGADRTEKSRMMFAQDKGIAENFLLNLSLNGLHIFRPGYIYPVTPRKEPNLSYKISRFLYPVLKLFGESMSIKSTELARAIFQKGFEENSSNTYENRDILAALKS